LQEKYRLRIFNIPLKNTKRIMLKRQFKRVISHFSGILFLFALPAMLFGAIEYKSGDPESFYVPTSGPYAPSESLLSKPLTGNWHMIVSKDDTRQVTVPGCWSGNVGSILLSTNFTVPEEWLDKHLKLVFWGARRQLSIKVNGRLIEAWDSDWPTIAIDLPKGLLNEGRPNDLEIEVHDKLSARESIPLKPKLYDELSYAGIFSDVMLIAGPTASVETLNWKVDFSSGYKTASWELSLDLRNQKIVSPDSIVTRKIKAHVEWLSPDGQSNGKSGNVTINLGAVDISQTLFKGVIRNSQLWSVDSPNLYDFKIVLEENGEKWNIPLVLGLTEIKWQSDNISLNGEKIKIRGIDLRQETESRGIAQSVEEIKKDLLEIKNHGFNLVRVIGGPPHPATADICDEIGLFLIPQTGLRGAPKSIFLTSEFSDRIKKVLWSMIRRDGLHPSIAAWGVGGWIQYDKLILDRIEGFSKDINRLDSRPLLVGFAINETGELPNGIVGLRQRPPYDLFEPVKRMMSTESSWLIGGIGGFATRTSLEEDSVRGQIRQADATLHHLKSVRMNPTVGFIIDSYADRKAALPLMIGGAESNADQIVRGLQDIKRERRISWQKVGDAMGELRINAPTLDLPKKDFPIVFPIATMIVGGFLLLMMRQNNVFRQNLKRVFAHTHGFFIDIRDRRYFQSGQSFIIALLISSSLAVIVASWLHHSRFDFGLDYLLTLVFPFYQVKLLLVKWAWMPIQGIAAFTAVNLLLLFFVTFMIWLIGLPFKGDLQLRQSFSLVSWAGSHFILLIPVGLVHYRFLEYGWFVNIVLIIYGLFWITYLVRIVSIIRIGYRVSHRSAWMIILIILIIGTGTTLAFYRSGFAITDYLNYYVEVIKPWVGA